MIFYKIKDFFTSKYKKSEKLYFLLTDTIKLSDIKYLSTCGLTHINHVDDAYILINKIQKKFNIEVFNYGFWDQGKMIFNSIKIINGECKIGVEYNGR